MTNNSTPIILAVDLDNTLIKTDMINVGLKFLLQNKIYLIPKLLWTFMYKGKTYAKEYLYNKSSFAIDDINFNDAVINFITTNKKKYSSTILISGSYYKYVDIFANHIGLFDYSVGTTLDTNMVGLNKVKYLKEFFDNSKFDYIGDSKKDIPIWEKARNAYVVNKNNISNSIKHINHTVIS